MKRKINFGILSILFLGASLTSCEEYPGESDYVTEQLVSVTAYDTNVNFYDTSKYKTYHIADSVSYVDEGTLKRVAIKDNQDLIKLTNEIKQNISTYLGYALTDAATADVGITLTVAKNTTYYVSYPWWWYFDWCYWDYWDCGWFPPYYPYNYPVVVGGYTSGTMAIDMFDLKQTIATNKRVAMWTGVVRGLLTGTHTDAEVNSAVDDCFKQTQAFQK